MIPGGGNRNSAPVTLEASDPIYLGTSRTSPPIVMIQPDAVDDAGGLAMSAALAVEANAPTRNARSQESRYRISRSLAPMARKRYDMATTAWAGPGLLGCARPVSSSVWHFCTVDREAELGAALVRR